MCSKKAGDIKAVTLKCRNYASYCRSCLVGSALLKNNEYDMYSVYHIVND